MPRPDIPLRAISYARARRHRALAGLQEFIRFPSVSTQPKHATDVRRCALWLADRLRTIGLDVSVVPTRRHPIVLARWEGAAGQPTLLIYGHYDVQPVEPLGDWYTPPFTPAVHGSDLVGRGASDDKGQMFAHVTALEAYLRTTRALPVNVKCLFEGEEEIGSPNLLPFISANRKALAADVAVISDTRMLAADRPALTYGERGALYLELGIRGPRHDLHSGNFGGAVHNPLQALCEIIARLHRPDGWIAIPGFYDQVRLWDARERREMARVGPSDRRIRAEAAVTSSWGEPGYSLYERLTLRPALTVNGISGGYQGPGAKGVIPACARAKLSFRLVPDQDPDDIDRLFRQHLERLTPKTVRSSVRTLSRARPALVDREHPAMHAAAMAYQRGFGTAPVFLRSGGTIPVVSTLQQVLQVPTVLMGFALPDDRMHAANEKFHLPNFYRGTEASIWFLAELAAAGRAIMTCSTRRQARPVPAV